MVLLWGGCRRLSDRVRAHTLKLALAQGEKGFFQMIVLSRSSSSSRMGGQLGEGSCPHGVNGLSMSGKWWGCSVALLWLVGLLTESQVGKRFWGYLNNEIRVLSLLKLFLTQTLNHAYLLGWAGWAFRHRCGSHYDGRAWVGKSSSV